MRARPFLILAAVLVVLGGLKLLQTTLHRAETRQSALESILPKSPTADQIGRIAVTGPKGTSVTLAREGGEWRVESSYGHKADTQKMDRIVADLTGLRGEFRSDDAAVLADYGLDDSTAVRVELFDLSGTSLGRVAIGERVLGGSGYFVTREGDKRAYVTQGNLVSSLGIWGDNREPEGKRFIDLKVMALERNNVDRLWIESADGRVDLVKEFASPAPAAGAEGAAADRGSYAWKLDGKEADKPTVDAVAGAIISLWARDVLDPQGEYGFALANKRAGVVMADGTSKVLEFGAEVSEGTETGVAMRIAGEPGVYMAPSNLPERIFKSKAELRSGPKKS